MGEGRGEKGGGGGGGRQIDRENERVRKEAGEKIIRK